MKLKVHNSFPYSEMPRAVEIFFFLVCLFIWKAETVKEIFLLLIHSLNVSSGQGRARPKPGSRSLFHPGSRGVAGVWALVMLSASSQVCLAGSSSRGGCSPRRSSNGRLVSQMGLNLLGRSTISAK